MNFEDTKKKLVSKYESLLDIAKRYDMELYTNDIQSTLDTAVQDQFIVTVIGEFSRGKSTLVNTILGTDLIPTGVRPTTATLNIIHFSEHPKLSLHKREGAILHLPIEGSALEDYTAHSDFDPSEVKYVEIGYPIDYLRDGTVIVDTPGVNDINEQRLEVTYGYIPVSDAVVILMDAGTPFKATEQNFLIDKVLCHDVGKVFLVLNKTDELGNGELVNDSISYVNENLEKMAFNTPPKLYALSAKNAFKGKISNDVVSVRESGWTNFESDLKQYIIGGEKGRFKLEKLNRQFDEHCSKLIDELDIRIFRHNESLDDLREELSKLNSVKETWEEKFNVLRNYILENAEILTSRVELSLNAKREEIYQSLDYQLKMQRGSLNDFVENTIPFFLQKSMKQWWEGSGAKIAKQMEIIQAKAISGFSKHFSKKPVMGLISSDYQTWIEQRILSTNLQGDDESVKAIERKYKVGGTIVGLGAALLFAANPILLITLPFTGSNLVPRIFGTKHLKKKQEEQKRVVLKGLKLELGRVFDACLTRIKGEVLKVFTDFTSQLETEFKQVLDELAHDIGQKVHAREGGLVEEEVSLSSLKLAQDEIMSLRGERGSNGI